MIPRRLSKLHFVQRQLRSTAFTIYVNAMNELFQHHESHDFVHALRAYFRAKRYDLALSFADSLSAQKYSDATTHFVANQFASLIKKYPWDPKVVKTNPETKAIRTFQRFEHRCKRLNQKFALYDSIRSPFEESLRKMRSFIWHLLGESPPIHRIIDNAAFGAGASLGVHGSATNLQRKVLADEWTVTPGAFTLSYQALMSNPHLRDLLLEGRNGISCYDWDKAKAAFQLKAKVVTNNKISFVPKTALTHRAIAVEPLLNGYLQKGTDVVMRKALLRIGIDLSDQSKNQRMARQGSLDDSDDGFCTIDLSSASDCISIGLVRNLLPPDWFYFLDQTRSKSYELDGKRYVYNKFCSMGNGFCFPLETLVFAACCHAVGAGVPGTDFSVYGDDIIIRKRHAENVLRLLKVLGFVPNTNKTFLQGPFRESCGADWFEGLDVRPYTLDYSLDSLGNLFKWLNLTRRNEMTTRFFEGTEAVIASIPHNFRFWRPFKGNPDSGIDAFGGEHLTSPNCFFERKEQIWYCRELISVPISDMRYKPDAYRRDSADMYALLSGVRSERYKVKYTFRRKTRTTITFTGYSGATSMWLPRI